MRARQFVDKLPEAIPPLFEVTELDPDVMREIVLVSYGASISPDRRTASISFTNGVPDAEPIPANDLYQLCDLRRLHSSMVVGDFAQMQRSSLETSLSALLRISEGNLDLPKRAKKHLGQEALWLTRVAIGLSLTTGPARYSHGYALFENRDPETKIRDHGEAYHALLPYMRKQQRKYIASKIPSLLPVE